MKYNLLEMTVHNHPGALLKICSLFARRAYNLESIICIPNPDSEFSRIWLTVEKSDRLQQIMAQTLKLPDVIDVQQRSTVSAKVFHHLQQSLANDGK